jgi:HD superfamily phosphohydrolase
MHLAGRVYDAVAAKSGGRLPRDPACRERRLVRVAALLHDLGHAPMSHTAEELFEEGIDHEEMTWRLLRSAEMEEIFARHGDGIDAEAVIRVLAGSGRGCEPLLSEIVTSQLDVDKMDYLLRDSLYCGVRYGNFDLERLLDTVVPLRDPVGGQWRIGVDHGGVHALEALVMARYYMFTQVYFNVTGKVLELHFNEWLGAAGWRWPADPERFLDYDDVTVQHAMRRSDNRHALAIVHRQRFALAFETEEHLAAADRERFAALLPAVRERFGAENVLVDHSSKDPHRLGQSRVLVRYDDGSLLPMAEASDFIAHMSRIDSFRVYAEPALREEVAAELRRLWRPDPPCRGRGAR